MTIGPAAICHPPIFALLRSKANIVIARFRFRAGPQTIEKKYAKTRRRTELFRLTCFIVTCGLIIAIMNIRSDAGNICGVPSTIRKHQGIKTTR